MPLITLSVRAQQRLEFCSLIPIEKTAGGLGVYVKGVSVLSKDIFPYWFVISSLLASIAIKVILFKKLKPLLSEFYLHNQPLLIKICPKFLK